MSRTALGLIGLGIGFLSGMSTSPVLPVVLTSLMAATAAVTTVFSELAAQQDPEERAKRAVSAWPLAVLVLSIVIGSLAGGWVRTTYALDRLIHARSQAAYAPPRDMAKAIEAWSALGLNRERVTNDLFAAHIGVVGDAARAVAESQARASTAALFAASAEECAGLTAAAMGGPQRLRTALGAAEDEAIVQLAAVLEDDELELLLQVICPEETR